MKGAVVFVAIVAALAWAATRQRGSYGMTAYRAPSSSSWPNPWARHPWPTT
jgi:hypothetical protein